MKLWVAQLEEPVLVDLARELAARGVQVTAGTTHHRTDHRAFREAPHLAGVPLVDARDLYELEGITRLAAEHGAPLDPGLLAASVAWAETYHAITDRLALLPRSHRYRRRCFRQLLRFADGYLAGIGVDALLFQRTPHLGWDLVLYEVARYRGLRTLVFGHTVIQDRVILREDFREVAALPEGGADLPAASADFVERCLVPSETLEVSKRRIRFLEEGLPTEEPSGRGSRIYRFARAAFWNLLLPRVHMMDLAMWGRQPRWMRPLLVRALRPWFSHLRRALAARAAPADGSEPYVLLALHLQPEMTTLPEAGVFEDILVAVEALAAALPEGWTLAVKENPSQGDPSLMLSSLLFREPGDYDDLLRIPRVRLLPPGSDMGAAIAGARLVATFTGTAGWEALIAGRPALVLGPAWYQACPSCFRVDRPEDFAAALPAALARGPDEVRADLERFLAWFERESLDGAIPEWILLGETARPQAELVASMADGVARRLGAPAR